MRRLNPSPVQPKPFPRSVEALVKELEALYPEQLPQPGQSRDDIMFRAGARALVVALRRKLDAANAAD